MLFGGLSALLGACAVSTPFPKIAQSSPGQADDPVVLVLTRVSVAADKRVEFDRQISRVVGSMGQHAGLLGYSARRELFGTEGWTLTVWANDEARAGFVRSAVHKEAMAKVEPAITGAEFKRVVMARKDLPASWDDALKLLAEPEGVRFYGQ